MKNKSFIKEINFNKYVSVYKKHLTPFPVLLVVPAYSIFFSKHLGFKLKKLFIKNDNGMWHAYVELDNWNKSHNIMFKLYEKDPKIMDKYLSKFKIEAKKYLKFTNTLTTTNLSKLSDKELLKLYQRYSNGYVKSFVYGECPAETLRLLLEKELKPKLMQIVKNKNELNKIFSMLLIPSTPSFTAIEEIELLKIAILAKKKGKISNKLKTHLHNYKWIPVDYNYEPWKLKDITSRLKEIMKDKFSPEKKITDTNNYMKSIKTKQKMIISKYKIPKNIVKDCITAQKCMILMDMKKEVYTKAHYHVQFLIKEISKRLGLTMTQTNYLTPDEIKLVLNGTETSKNNFRKKYSKKLINSRYKQSIYCGDGIKVDFLNKKEEKEVRKHLDKKLEQKKELNGICGNPGKVKAKARIILNTKEFKKMKKGEVLITPYTTPEFLPVMKKASAIVTDMGGVTSHSSIVARELNIPCVVGTKHATKLIKDNDLLEINAIEGKVKIKKR
ncbi:hypothetical protein HOC35_04920 [Candidatus Woesearchaeota archaeon]|jgi:phosphohistidine swiveling domain-containing protein|nr:hypothetical protein [Candidatus Woesearchaeota archaeon]